MIKSPTAQYNFKKDLPTGQAAEDELMEILKKRGHKILDRSDNKYYDFKVQLKTKEIIKIEVKRDLQAHRTGNLVVEFISKGQRSGICTTQADVWFFRLEDGFWSIGREKLRTLIKEEKYKEIRNGGDYKSSTMFYFDANYLKSEMTKLV